MREIGAGSAGGIALAKTPRRRRGSTNVEALDQGKHARGGGRAAVSDTMIHPNDKVVMEMTSGGSVPGVTDQDACEESACVEGKIANDDLDELQGKLGGGGYVHRSRLESSLKFRRRQLYRRGHRGDTPQVRLDSSVGFSAKGVFGGSASEGGGIHLSP